MSFAAKPADGVTRPGAFAYHANDMSVGDIDNDGEYEYFVKWDPDNSHDVSIKGYTGRCFIDCYKLDGTLVWRLDMGRTSAPERTTPSLWCTTSTGTAGPRCCQDCARHRDDPLCAWTVPCCPAGHITMPPEGSGRRGTATRITYVCTAQDYRLRMAEVFRRWHTHPEVVNGRWPATVEQCFGLAPQYAYPLCEADALRWPTISLMCTRRAAAPKRAAQVRGFVYDGPST